MKFKVEIFAIASVMCALCTNVYDAVSCNFAVFNHLHMQTNSKYMAADNFFSLGVLIFFLKLILNDYNYS